MLRIHSMIAGRVYRMPEGEGSGGDGGKPPPKGDEVEGDDGGRKVSDYERALRFENKQRRQQYEAEKARADAADAAKVAAEKDRDEKVSAATRAANETLIRAELRIAAKDAGIIDLDLLKLVDLSTLEIDEKTGEVKGVEKVIADMKKAKPYGFGTTNSSRPGDPPKGGNPEAKHATKMTDEEYLAAKANLLATGK